MIHLRGSGCDVVIDLATGTPSLAYWGAPLGDGFDLDSVAAALDPPLPHATLDAVAPISFVPEHGSGFTGRPGLVGHRGGGRAWAPRFGTAGHHVDGNRLTVNAVDPIAELELVTVIELDHTLVVSTEVRNVGTGRYHLEALTVTLPIPQDADELCTFTGRWTREFQPVRQSWEHGSHVAENRRGRTSHEHPPLLFAGTRSFGEWSGRVWGAHLAWSGNHAVFAERLPEGRRFIQLGELLHPGEIVLEAGERYRTPDVVAVHSEQGLTPATWQFHRALRSRSAHPTAPRPVLLNTWEAVYFNHDLDVLQNLATQAARVGVERFVLDDGWFGGRRNDAAGLGDWWVSHDAHPVGLGPLIEHVESLGMQFGIWVEPEMINPDSDTYRAHPDWALKTAGYEHLLGRNQLVLDLGQPDAYEHILSHLDALLRDHSIGYVKWDMNRDHAQGSGATGAAGTHAQTLALYRLLDELRQRHPTVEFESCASGGARIDHAILQRTDRVWTSDCNDALERQSIQRGVSMLIPPELMGAHIGPTRSHTTGRTHDLSFRAATALFGHLGIEWNLLGITGAELADLAQIVELHQRLRPLLHSGDAVRFDTEDAYVAHGVYAADRSQAVVSFAVVTTAASLSPPPLRLPGLDVDRRYRVEHLPLPGGRWGPARRQPDWIETGITLTGRQLEAHGIQPPILHPESAVLLTLTAL